MRKSNQGFTLIELMVVIVIIGILASLAIPRFTEASMKAKAAEAPRVLATFESAYLAAETEVKTADLLPANLVFDPAAQSSKFFTYKVEGTAGVLTATATPEMGTGLDGSGNLGLVTSLTVPYNATQAATKFTRACSGTKCPKLLAGWTGTN